MSFDASGNRFCDDCKRTMVKATRIYRGKEYCAACYKREFRAMICDECHTVSRHHRDYEGPYICPVCIQRTRTCARCRKPVPSAGRVLTDGRAVCPSCVSYFRQPAPCTTCPRWSTRLARMPKYGVTTLICERCQGHLTNRTCSVCRRYRRIVGKSADGKPYCRACDPANPQTHGCRGCGIMLPGNGEGMCRDCLMRRRLLRTAALEEAGMRHEWSGRLVRDYATWLASTRSHVPVIFRRFLNHMPFFHYLDASFTTVSDLTSSTLLGSMRVADMRRYLLPMTFLKERLGVVIGSPAREAQVEGHRIQQIITRADHESWAPLLNGYQGWLELGETTLRTRRLLLRAAEVFCRSQRVQPADPWPSGAISSFLRRYPGYRASLFKFVTYVRTCLGWAVSMPKTAAVSKPPATLKDLRTLLQRISERGVDRAPVRDLARTIAKALGFRIADLDAGSWTVRVASGATHLLHGDDDIVIPPTLVPIVTAWCRRRRKA
jgi:hypothetical protein